MVYATCVLDLLKCPGHFGYVELDLPVYHVGYFKHVINCLQCICKECSRVLLSEDQRRMYLNLFRNRKDPHEREAVRVKVQDDCKKVKVCPWCQEYNGTVKKVVGQALKVVYDKFNEKTVPKEVMDEFIEEFNYSCAVQPNEGFS